VAHLLKQPGDMSDATFVLCSSNAVFSACAIVVLPAPGSPVIQITGGNLALVNPTLAFMKSHPDYFRPHFNVCAPIFRRRKK
jgi:hypothetical protein